MIIDKQELSQKLQRAYKRSDKNEKYCRICSKKITLEDLQNDNFEYVKSKINENYFHSKCIKNEHK